jgi:exodeoxyribonuclease V beta subunit
VVVDYKSNRLHLRGGVPQPGDYAEPNMVEAMEQHNYPLQALLYQVALHRYLRARVDGYDPSLHLGGASYLFLRGMAGPESAACDGVMSWEWPVAAIEEISDVLAGRQP